MAFWYRTCPVCQQGRLFAEIALPDGAPLPAGAPLLECEECSRAWPNPADADAVAEPFIALQIASRYATTAEITEAGWPAAAFREGS